MSNHLAHFAVCAEDVDRARAFYESAFGWGFEPWGPPDFHLVHTDGPGRGGPVPGALQRRFEVVPGTWTSGWECTLGVDDLDAAIARIEAAGGKVIMPKATIPTVGTLIRFADTEGNVAGAMQYDATTG